MKYRYILATQKSPSHIANLDCRTVEAPDLDRAKEMIVAFHAAQLQQDELLRCYIEFYDSRLEHNTEDEQ